MIIFFSRLQSLPLFQSFFFFRWAPTPVDAVEGGGRQGAWPRSARWWKEEWAWPQSDRCWSRNKRSGSIYKLLPRGQKPDLGLCPDQLETHPFPHLFTDSPNQPPAAAKRDKGFKELFVLLLLFVHIDSFFICFLNKSRFRNFRFYKLKLTELSTKNAKQSKSEK